MRLVAGIALAAGVGCHAFGSSGGGAPGATGPGPDAGEASDGALVEPPSPIFRDRAFSDDTDSTATSIVVHRPPATQPDDIIIAVLYTDDQTPVGVPPSWQQIDTLQLPCSAGFASWAYTRATGTDPESWNFPRKADIRLADLLSLSVSYGGVLEAGPSDHRIKGSGADPETLPSLPLDVANTLVLATYVLRITPTEWVGPPGTVQRATVGRLALFDGIRPSAGATPAYTADQGATCWAGATIALKPHG